ncbi:hypothetical protein JCM16418A_41890 [Paenibacillus pini]
MLNYKLIAIKIGVILKSNATKNEINRVGLVSHSRNAVSLMILLPRKEHNII